MRRRCQTTDDYHWAFVLCWIIGEIGLLAIAYGILDAAYDDGIRDVAYDAAYDDDREYFSRTETICILGLYFIVKHVGIQKVVKIRKGSDADE